MYPSLVVSGSFTHIPRTPRTRTHAQIDTASNIEHEAVAMHMVSPVVGPVAPRLMSGPAYIHFTERYTGKKEKKRDSDSDSGSSGSESESSSEEEEDDDDDEVCSASNTHSSTHSPPS